MHSILSTTLNLPQPMSAQSEKRIAIGMRPQVFLEGGLMSNEPEIARILSERELVPTIYEVEVLLADGTKEVLRMNLLDLNSGKASLGLPYEV